MRLLRTVLAAVVFTVAVFGVVSSQAEKQFDCPAPTQGFVWVLFDCDTDNTPINAPNNYTINDGAAQAACPNPEDLFRDCARKYSTSQVTIDPVTCVATINAGQLNMQLDEIKCQ